MGTSQSKNMATGPNKPSTKNAASGPKMPSTKNAASGPNMPSTTSDFINPKVLQGTMKRYFQENFCYDEFVIRKYNNIEEQNAKGKLARLINTCKNQPNKGVGILAMAVQLTEGWHSNMLLVFQNKKQILHLEPHSTETANVNKQGVKTFVERVAKAVPDYTVVNPAVCGMNQGATPWCLIYTHLMAAHLLLKPELREKKLRAEVKNIAGDASRLKQTLEFLEFFGYEGDMKFVKGLTSPANTRPRKYTNVTSYFTNLILANNPEKLKSQSLSNEEEHMIQKLVPQAKSKLATGMWTKFYNPLLYKPFTLFEEDEAPNFKKSAVENIVHFRQQFLKSSVGNKELLTPNEKLQVGIIQ